tara:strand:- start:304 stop:507 length:204 start_codon:yes stop_codon:yes gene_type:complete
MVNELNSKIEDAYNLVVNSIQNKNILETENAFDVYSSLIDFRNRIDLQEIEMGKITGEFWKEVYRTK